MTMKNVFLKKNFFFVKLEQKQKNSWDLMNIQRMFKIWKAIFMYCMEVEQV